MPFGLRCMRVLPHSSKSLVPRRWRIAVALPSAVPTANLCWETTLMNGMWRSKDVTTTSSIKMRYRSTGLDDWTRWRIPRVVTCWLSVCEASMMVRWKAWRPCKRSLTVCSRSSTTNRSWYASISATLPSRHKSSYLTRKCSPSIIEAWKCQIMWRWCGVMTTTAISLVCRMHKNRNARAVVASTTTWVIGEDRTTIFGWPRCNLVWSTRKWRRHTTITFAKYG